jgi:hypothetical protein
VAEVVDDAAEFAQVRVRVGRDEMVAQVVVQGERARHLDAERNDRERDDG